MSTRTRRATQLAAENVKKTTITYELQTESVNENMEPNGTKEDRCNTKDTAQDAQVKSVLVEQDQNQPNHIRGKCPTPVTSNQKEPLKRKLSRPLRVVKAEETEVATAEQEEEEAVKSDDEESGADEEDTEEVQDDPDDDEFTLRPKKQRVEQPRKITPLKATKEMSDYERMRLENIRKNEEMLLALQLPALSMKLQADTVEGKVDSAKEDEPKKFAPMAGKPRKPKAAPKSVATVTPSRTSSRLRGLKPAAEDEVVESPTSTPTSTSTKPSTNEGKSDDEDDDNIDRSTLMAADLFFDEETRNNAIRVDGHYKGWVNKDVMERYGFEKNAAEAWEANGGGTFSFKDPTGAGASGRPKKFNAKLSSKAMFKKNPNAYFYRHNEPGEDQWTGDWTAEERELFLEVARQHGCGDKWGLFASHIPHRVGYQCSNYYRQVILPEGLVFDPNYEFTSNGRPIYCGKYNQRR